MEQPPPPAPTPDTKDWTWVLDRRCRECGFIAAQFPVEQVGEQLRAIAAAFAEFLDGPSVRRRPAPTTWSALEYGCHVRDTCRISLHRLDRMLHEDGPHFANWDQDETALTERYDLQDPAVVAVELRAAAEELAQRFDGVHPEQWARTGSRSDGATFTVRSFARYMLHDPVHHVWDVWRRLP